MALIFCSILLAFLITANIFIKKKYLNFAVFWLGIGVIVLYFQAGYTGFIFIEVALLIVSGYNLVKIAEVKK